jgi:hypothetical protein
VRTQIQLTEEQTARVKRIARRRGVSMATVVRDAIDRLDDVSDAQHERAWSRFRSAVGSFHGGTGDVSEHHDDVLASAYAE